MSFDAAFRRIQAKKERDAEAQAEKASTAAIPIESTGYTRAGKFSMGKNPGNYVRMISEVGSRKTRQRRHPSATEEVNQITRRPR